MYRRQLIGLFFAACAVVGFASTFVFGGALTKQCAVSPSVLSFLRFLFAGLALLVCVRRLPMDRAAWLQIAWLGPVGTSLMAWFVFMGCARVSTANASMADALTPLMIFVFAVLKTRHADWMGLSGFVCGFLGALLVIQVVTLDGLMLSAYTSGDVYIALSALTWGVYTVYGRELVRRLGAIVFSVATMLTGALAIGLILPFASATWPTTGWAWLLVLGLAFVSTLMPFVTWNLAQKYLPMSVLAVVAYFTPVVAMALGVIFLHESVSPLQWVGTAFVILSALTEVRRVQHRACQDC